MKWSLSLVLIAAFNNPFWVLIHEAIHDLFHGSRVINWGVGRALAVFFGSPFQVLRWTHLSHHKFNRSPVERGTEVYNPGEVSKLRASFGYFFYILCGLYLLEVSSTLLFFLPPKVFSKLRQRAVDGGNAQENWLATKFMDHKLIRDIRIDGIAICLIFGLSAFCYREHWRLFAGLLIARTFLVSFLDNVYHYRTPLYHTISGHNLWLPQVLSTLLLHFNLHRVHHAHPSVPWAELPECFARDFERFDRNFFAAAFVQLYGPVSTFELDRLVHSRESG